MSKVVIRIEDKSTNKVSVKVSFYPPIAKNAKKLTPAQVAAMEMVQGTKRD